MSGNIIGVIDQEDYKRWNEARMTRKKPMPAMAHGVLQRWLANGKKDEDLSISTFRHIVSFMRDGKDSGRLDVALGDYGYTREELKGKKPEEIAQEIVNRGVNPNPDDSDSD
jgi:hypothetical protein